MKKSVMLLSAIMFLVAGTLAAQQQKGPRIEVKEDKYELGRVVQGTQAEHVFEIRNTGSEPLVIDRVQPS